MHDKMMWFNDKIPYIFHANIVEWDMERASLSVCERFNLLDKNEIQRMKALPKLEREIAMGKHQRGNKEFSNQLLSGIREIRRKFLEVNGLDETNILSLHNDAIIFNSRKKIISEIDGIKFHHDNTCNAYIRFERAEIFYSEDSTGLGTLDFKNVGKEKIQEHTMGLNKYVIKVCSYLENYNKDVIKYMRKFQKKYLKQQLPEYYYSAFARVGDFSTANLQFLGFMANIVMREVSSWK
jgi:hypothetical protein